MTGIAFSYKKTQNDWLFLSHKLSWQIWLVSQEDLKSVPESIRQTFQSIIYSLNGQPLTFRTSLGLVIYAIWLMIQAPPKN